MKWKVVAVRRGRRWLIRHVFFPAKDMLMGTRSLEVLAELERVHWLSRTALQELQWTRLREIVQHAYETVPYYQRVFRERDLRPDDIVDWEAFADLVPLLTRADVQREKRGLVSCRPGPRPAMARSSGATGCRKIVWTGSYCRSYSNASRLRAGAVGGASA